MTTRERWEVRCGDAVVWTHRSRHYVLKEAKRLRIFGRDVRFVHVTTTIRSRAWSRNGHRVRVRMFGASWFALRKRGEWWRDLGSMHATLAEAVAAANAWADAQPKGAKR